MKKFLLMTIALATSLFAWADNTILYGSYDGSGTLAGAGTLKAETYDIALHVTNPDLAGLEVHGLRVPINTNATGATNYKAWLSKDLALDGTAPVMDIASISFTPDGSWADVTFETPYVITEEGFYAGYSFTIPSVDTSNNSDPNKTPLMALSSQENEGWFVHCSRSFRKWTTFEASVTFTRFTPAMCLILGGENVKANAAALRAPADLESYSLVGKKKTLNFILINHGTQDIKNIEYEMTIGEETTQHTAKLSSALKGTYYGKTADLKISLPAINEPGSYPITFRVTKVNGVDNEDLKPSTTMEIAIIAQMPVHKPLVEEYTGGWCQWCPRGMAAMEAMTELYGDDFVGVAYHNGDAMQVVSTPNNPSGYPHAYIDRVVDGDPFFGTGSASLGIQNDWKTRRAIVPPAELQLQAQWADAEWKTINITTNVNFIRSFEENPFRLFYVLVADDLHGTGREWAQQNAYAGRSESDKYLSPLTKLPGVITNMRFNDVAIKVSGPSGATVQESLPASVHGAVPYEHDYTFDVSNNALVQDPMKLRVVVALVDTRTGEVVNAEKATVELPTGYLPIQADAQPGTIRFTDLSGRPVAQPRQGVVIRTEQLSDGTLRSHKQVLR